MHRLRYICLAFALGIAPLTAPAQSGNIYLDTPNTLEYDLHLSVAPGTEYVYCYQQSGMIVVGSADVATASTASVPVSLPDPVIRCAACNSWGCSSLSSNAAVVMARNPLDVNGSGSVDVADMGACITAINAEIY